MRQIRALMAELEEEEGCAGYGQDGNGQEAQVPPIRLSRRPPRPVFTRQDYEYDDDELVLVKMEGFRTPPPVPADIPNPSKFQSFTSFQPMGEAALEVSASHTAAAAAELDAAVQSILPAQPEPVEIVPVNANDDGCGTGIYPMSVEELSSLPAAYIRLPRLTASDISSAVRPATPPLAGPESTEAITPPAVITDVQAVAVDSADQSPTSTGSPAGPDAIPEVGGSTPALGGSAVTSVAKPALANSTLNDVPVRSPAGPDAIPEGGGSTPTLGDPVVLPGSVTTPQLVRKSGNSTTNTGLPPENRSHKLPAGARIKSVGTRILPAITSDEAAANTLRPANVKVGLPSVYGKKKVKEPKSVEVAGFHRSAKNPPPRQPKSAVPKRPTEGRSFGKRVSQPAEHVTTAAVTGSQQAVPYTPSRVGPDQPYSPAPPSAVQHRLQHRLLTEEVNTGQTYRPTPLSQCPKSKTEIDVQLVANISPPQPTRLLVPVMDGPTRFIAPPATDRSSTSPTVSSTYIIQQEVAGAPQVGIPTSKSAVERATSATTARKSSLDRDEVLSPSYPLYPAYRLIPMASVSATSSMESSELLSQWPADADPRKAARRPEPCPPDHALRGIISFVAFEMGRWERQPITMAIHQEFQRYGLTMEQCRAYGLLAMEALQTATLACQLRYDSGDVNHDRAIQTWRQGILRKVDRHSPERPEIPNPAASRETDVGEDEQPMAPKRPRLDQLTGDVEFLDLAPRPDMSYSPETIISTPRPGEWVRRPTSAIVRPAPTLAPPAPTVATVGDMISAGRVQEHRDIFPNNVDGRRANQLFPRPPYPKSAAPVPSLLSMPTVQWPVNLPASRSSGPGALRRTTPSNQGGASSRHNASVSTVPQPSSTAAFNQFAGQSARKDVGKDQRTVLPSAPSGGNRPSLKKAAPRRS